MAGIFADLARLDLLWWFDGKAYHIISYFAVVLMDGHGCEVNILLKVVFRCSGFFALVMLQTDCTVASLGVQRYRGFKEA